MRCEMCGREGNLNKADIEGSVLSVCEGCSSFGTVISSKLALRQRSISPYRLQEPEKLLALIPNYPSLIRQKREAISLTQEEFAKKIGEKISLVHKIETGAFDANIAIAKKIERVLGIKLVQEQSVPDAHVQKGPSAAYTIGDILRAKSK